MLGNFRNAYQDGKAAIKCDPENVKAREQGRGGDRARAAVAAAAPAGQPCLQPMLLPCSLP